MMQKTDNLESTNQPPKETWVIGLRSMLLAIILGAAHLFLATVSYAATDAPSGRNPGGCSLNSKLRPLLTIMHVPFHPDGEGN